MQKTLTDKKIVIEALKCCIGKASSCNKCPYFSLMKAEKDCGGAMMSDTLEILMEPERPSHRKLPCTCGRIRLQLFNDFQDKRCSYYKCPKCGKEGPHAANPWAAIREWNKMIEEETEHE